MGTLYDYCKENNKEYLLQEWDYELNKDFDVKTILTGSNKKVWWKCTKCNGVWQASICDRTRKQSTGCPYCANQKVLKGYNDLATKYQDAIKQWHPTKNGNLTPYNVMGGSSKKVWWMCPKGHEFEQKINARVKHLSSCPICSGQKVSKGDNDLASQYPLVAQEWNYEKNINTTPYNITWGSNKKFWWKCNKCSYEWQARVSDRTRGQNGCPVCANKTLAAGINDLATKFPDIAKEWHPTKNGELKPDKVLAASPQKVWWKCLKGHDFLQSVNLRRTRNQGCPICNNQKILVGYNDLAITHPEIAREWHPTKNGDLTPRDVVAGSTKRVWWICSKGHEFIQSINHRTTRNHSCPYCSGQKVLTGFNDLATTNPQLAKEWHPTRNGDLKPENVFAGSSKKVWWLCPIGHEYRTAINNRNNGTNCPICNMRKTTSFPEQAIFFYLKQIFPDALNKYNEHFKNTMEFDIYIPSLNIAIEYDGAIWHKTEEQYQREIKKYNFCKENKIYLIRIKEQNDNDWKDVADKIYYISKSKRSNFKELEEVIQKLLCADLNTKEAMLKIDLVKDKYKILNYVYEIKNSLADMRPDVAKKWNYKKNRNLKPNMFSVCSNEIVWWLCPDCGNEWETSINSMTREGRFGCPECSKKQKGKTFTKGVVARAGSLAEKMPELAKEWHPTKNNDLKPCDVTIGSFKAVWWLCKKCGHEWQARPSLRKRGIGCPCCSGRVPKIGVNDLETLYPQIAKEWNYKKNGELKPNMFKSGSGKKVWWICPECNNEYEATIAHRTAKIKPTCPICGHKKGAKSCSFSVNMFDINTNELLRTFNSVTEASKTMHICYENISKTCKGERQEAGGYKWSYAK